MNGFNVEYEKKKCMEDLLFSICGLIFGQQKKSYLSLEITNLNINSIIDSIFNKELMQYAVEHVAI